MSETAVSHNPYVGPRTFEEAEADRFFGREREARELVALVLSERLTLFYAQSGAGKSSLLNARLVPRLRDKEGFAVLPVGRVSGVLPDGVDLATVDNIFVYHLDPRLELQAERAGSPTAGDQEVGRRGSRLHPAGALERRKRSRLRSRLPAAPGATHRQPTAPQTSCLTCSIGRPVRGTVDHLSGPLAGAGRVLRTTQRRQGQAIPTCGVVLTRGMR